MGSEMCIRDSHLIIDLQSGVEWMRCSVGQQWNGTSCDGEIIRLNHHDVAKAIVIANEQLGGDWRLPTVKELQTIVSKVENRPDDFEANIDLETFPNTFAGPYWSSDKSFYSRQYQWSVNFFTGQSYNRFFPSQKLAVRLVRKYTIR